MIEWKEIYIKKDVVGY